MFGCGPSVSAVASACGTGQVDAREIFICFPAETPIPRRELLHPVRYSTSTGEKMMVGLVIVLSPGFSSPTSTRQKKATQLSR